MAQNDCDCKKDDLKKSLVNLLRIKTEEMFDALKKELTEKPSCKKCMYLTECEKVQDITSKEKNPHRKEITQKLNRLARSCTEYRPSLLCDEYFEHMEKRIEQTCREFENIINQGFEKLNIPLRISKKELTDEMKEVIESYKKIAVLMQVKGKIKRRGDNKILKL